MRYFSSTQAHKKNYCITTPPPSAVPMPSLSPSPPCSFQILTHRWTMTIVFVGSVVVAGGGEGVILVVVVVVVFVNIIK